MKRPGSSVRARVVELRDGTRLEHEDRLAGEEPLEIRLEHPGGTDTLAVTMRTPGQDFELAAGWVVHEQIVSSVSGVRYCTDVSLEPEQEFNVVTVTTPEPPLRLPVARSVSSACGVCGSDSIDAVLRSVPAVAGIPPVSLPVLLGLPAQLRDAQPGFERTGGLHAAGLFLADGTTLAVREDVGRHNAVDKVAGSRLLSGSSPGDVLVLSGRVGFELVQKAAVSRIPVIVAVGAPTSLAVELASRAGIALVGFTRAQRCVVYTGAAGLGV